MVNVIKMLLPLHFYADNKHIPKNSSFFSEFNLTNLSVRRLCQNLGKWTANHVI
jgi:hypothetical protein